MKEYKNPAPTVDLIIENKKGEILLIERKNEPYGWALPGGFVDYGESLEHAAIREGKEETNLDIILISQFKSYSDPERDKRYHTITKVFVAKGKGIAQGMDDAKRAMWFSPEEIENLNIAFDHKKIIKEYIEFKNFLKEKNLSFEDLGKFLLDG